MGKSWSAHRERAAATSNPERAFADEFAVSVCPNLVGFLTEEIPGPPLGMKNTLTLFWDSGCWKVAVSDKGGSLKTFTTLSSLEGFLEACERLFTEPDTDWRKDRYRGK
jgi:hypothetical protein